MCKKRESARARERERERERDARGEPIGLEMGGYNLQVPAWAWSRVGVHAWVYAVCVGPYVKGYTLAAAGVKGEDLEGGGE